MSLSQLQILPSAETPEINPDEELVEPLGLPEEIILDNIWSNIEEELDGTDQAFDA